MDAGPYGPSDHPSTAVGTGGTRHGEVGKVEDEGRRTEERDENPSHGCCVDRNRKESEMTSDSKLATCDVCVSPSEALAKEGSGSKVLVCEVQTDQHKGK